jgi:phosphoribosylamine--glycine ligase
LKAIIVGSGGREHALGWALARGWEGAGLTFLPGNGGTGLIGENVDVNAGDVDAVTAYCLDNPSDLVIIGPEDPLAAGLADRLAGRGIRVFGPTADCARLESSKVWAKEFMARYSVPTAGFEVFTDAARAHAHIDQVGGPVVVKASGLARGKGAVVTASREEAHAAVREIMEERVFGGAGDAVVIEERLSGEEVSVLAVTDGESYVLLPPSQDHKPILDGDRGPNTGGMGAYCPVPLVDGATLAEIDKSVFRRTLKGLRAEGLDYRGVIYAGLIVNSSGVFVIEYNARFGDPETQAILPATDADIGDLLMRAADGGLRDNRVIRASRWAVCVVLASQGYPGEYSKGKTITGADPEAAGEGVHFFHAGTSAASGTLVTAGGRVMGVTGTGDSLREARRRAYDASRLVGFEGKYMRSDIASKGIVRLEKTEVS